MDFPCRGFRHPPNCGCPIGNRKPHDHKIFKKNGEPTLSHLRSKFQKDGWLVLAKVKIENLTCGTIIHAVALDSPTVLDFGFKEQIILDKLAVYVFRKARDLKSEIELKALPQDDPGADQEATYGFLNCGTEIELRSKLSRS